MRLWTVLGLLGLAACSQPQPGCNPDNCRLMLQACRVELQGGPADLAICTGFDRPPAPPDFSKYCVDSCNAVPGSGQFVSCIASKAEACRDAGLNFTKLTAAIQPCIDQQPVTKAPEATCDDKCIAARRTCDDACSGGKPCDTCLRSGGSCASVCSDAGYQVCLDCSGQCGLKFLNCSQQCPRVQ